jgi:hypothetical protein
MGHEKNILQMLLGSQLTLPDGVWMRLNQAWIAYCAFMSAVNAYVVMNFSTEFWVDFKLWGYAFPSCSWWVKVFTSPPISRATNPPVENPLYRLPPCPRLQNKCTASWRRPCPPPP